jgi:hypothetical protein
MLKYILFLSIIIVIIILIVISIWYIIFNCAKNKIANSVILKNKIINNEKNYYIPKIVWVYWNDKNKIPTCIQNILNNNLKLLKKWKLIFLDDTTIEKYIPPENMPSFDGLLPAQKADWIRLYLIYTYGGCWCDAAIIINNESTLLQLRNISIQKKSLFTGFYFESRIVDNNIFSFIECWFILAPKNSILINMWMLEFEKAIKIGLLKYKRLLILSGKLNLKEMYNYRNKDTYLTVQTCLYKISSSLPKYILDHILLYKAENSMFKIQDKCKWNRKCIHHNLNYNSNVKQIPFIKLVTNDRKNFNLDKYHLL